MRLFRKLTKIYDLRAPLVRAFCSRALWGITLITISSPPLLSVNATPNWRDLSASDQECQDCHPDQVEAWETSAMGRGFQLLNSDQPAHQLARQPAHQLARQPAHQLTHPNSRNQYRVFETSTLSRHGARARLTFDQTRGALTVSRTGYASIGATRAQTFIWEREGALYEAPLTRYSRDQAPQQTESLPTDKVDTYWGLSPGYLERDQELMRPITEGCLFCHAEPTRPSSGTLNRYTPPPSVGISCSRCHGDARAHAQGRARGEAISTHTPDNVCDQCHFNGVVRVTRAGRSWSDHTPGAPLHETIAVMTRLGESATLNSVSQRARLEESACFKESAALTCATCHQPHAKTIRPRDAACHECHASTALSSVAHPKGKPLDCIRCHMPIEGRRDIPHLSAVDHWIRVRPQAGDTRRPREIKTSADPLVWSADPQPDPSDPDHQLLLGRAYYKAWRQGRRLYDLRRAYSMLTRALPRRLKSVEGWATLAALAAEMSASRALPELGGEIGARLALDSAERAYTLNPLRADTTPLLGALYLDVGRPRDALTTIQPLLTRDPTRVELLSLKARALSALGQPREAARSLGSLLALNPFDIRARFELALNAQASARWSEARAQFSALLKLEPEWREARLNLGWVELQSGRVEAALSAFIHSGDTTERGAVPPQLRAQAELGAAVSLESLGQTSEAARHARLALKLGSNAHQLWGIIGRAAHREGRLIAAREALETQIKLNPTLKTTWLALAELYERLGDTERARVARERAAER